MQEIKFRVWEKPGVLLSPTAGTEDFEGQMHCEDDWKFWDYALAHPEEYVIMQWTYLEDKNQKKIYDGDIGRILGNLVCEIYWDYGSWQIRNQGREGGLLSNINDSIEIIGNIYENPNLLSQPTTA